MIEAIQNEGREPLPEDMEVVRLPENFFEIKDRITRPFERDAVFGTEKTTVQAVDGFEDILDEPLGAGVLYNTPTSVYQLAFALAVSQNPTVEKIAREAQRGSAETIKVLRDNAVLSGRKVIDLGCGVPNFASAVHALGAKVYTADVDDLPKQQKKGLERHIAINLNQPDAVEILRDATGSDFDIVTENIISTVMTETASGKIKRPAPWRIVEIGDALLKHGGYLYYGKSFGTREVLRKK